MSRDFVAVGIANATSGFFRGLPVGPSLATTALSLVSGARSHWAAIFSGIWIGFIVIALPDVVGRVAMPALAAILIVASVGTLKPREAYSLWNTGWGARIASIATFLATLFLPIQLAVAIGVGLSALVYLLRSASEIRLVEQVERPDGLIEEREPSAQLRSNTVTILDVYGQLFFAAARTLERRLPDPRGAAHPVVILRLRGHTQLGATLIQVLSRYADRLEGAGGRLYLSGLDSDAHKEAVRSRKLDLSGPVRLYDATSIVGESTRKAFADATAWLVQAREEEEREGAAKEESTG
jgi:SulP family sulfate permease